ncbi:transposase [Corynebacterium mustelae]|uniref:Transposase n=1 Tax=Corynebacterium mustelae TaxID=571915 RepID=A0A0G3GXJ6_9CORY|nr:IS481 family transposase [Corynebacterium mustelae]AKK05884.1 transposase [Corynebacterium mustelae]
MNSPHRNLAIVRYVVDQGHTVAEAAQHFKVSRQWVYTILHRFEAGGEAAVQPRSKKPCVNPRAVTDSVRHEIITIRINLTKAGFDAGPDTIASHLRRQGMHVLSTSTIRRIITAAGLVKPQPQKRPKSSYVRFEAALPNECWQADVTYCYLANGQRVEILDFLDDHSRYLLFIKAYPICTGVDVVDAMQQLISTYGTPQSTLTDNGMIFTARFAGMRGGRNGFEVFLNKHHIQQKNGRPGHPQTQGKIERFHQTLKKWLKAQPTARTITQLQHQLDAFAKYYNTQRPHRALAKRTPYEAYTHLPKASPLTRTDNEWRTRKDKVDKAGRVTLRYAGRLYHLGIGRPYSGQKVTMVIVDKHITTALTATGEILTEHVIDETRDYQKPIWKNTQK